MQTRCCLLIVDLEVADFSLSIAAAAHACNLFYLINKRSVHDRFTRTASVDQVPVTGTFWTD